GVNSAGSATSAPAAAARSSQEHTGSQRPAHTDPIDDAGPLHRILEGTIIDAVLTNGLDGGAAAPVNCLVTNAVYSHSGGQVVIPAGARLLGETKPVQTFGETRLAVAFHRLLLPDGSTYSLDQYPGANQVGDAGLKDQVDNHYWSTFGAAAAIGLISGLAQAIGTAGLSAGEGNRTVVITGARADAASQAASQAMDSGPEQRRRPRHGVLRTGAPASASAPSRSEQPACDGPAHVRKPVRHDGNHGFGGADRCTPSRTGEQLLRQAAGRYPGT